VTHHFVASENLIRIGRRGENVGSELMSQMERVSGRRLRECIDLEVLPSEFQRECNND
jgi:hypothetical protein